jgi:hypothetical protein
VNVSSRPSVLNSKDIGDLFADVLLLWEMQQNQYQLYYYANNPKKNEPLSKVPLIKDEAF